MCGISENVDETMSAKNWDAVADLPYSDTVKAYLAAQIELDKALEYLVDALEEKGMPAGASSRLAMREMPSSAELAPIDVDGRCILAPPCEVGGLLGLHARLVAALSLAAVVRGVMGPYFLSDVILNSSRDTRCVIPYTDTTENLFH